MVGETDSRVVLEIKTPEGQFKTVSLIRSIPASTTRTSVKRAYSVLSDGFGFIDTVHLSNVDVEKALEEVKDTPGIIF